MSARLRSSKRTRYAADCTIPSVARNKRERRKVGPPPTTGIGISSSTTTTTTAAAAAASVDCSSTTSSSSLATTATTTSKPTPAAAATTTRSTARAEHESAEAAVPAEKVDIKVEPFDLTSDGEAEIVDVKPDVQQLQQALLWQQQQQPAHQQQELLPASALLSAAGALPPLPTGVAGAGGKRVYIIGDLATLTSLANSGSSIALGCLAGAPAEGVAIASGVGEGGSVALLNAATPTIASAGAASAGAASTMQLSAKTVAASVLAGSSSAATTTTRSKTVSDTFVRDEFDLQHSDVDEDGYSDIDFDDDDDFVEDDAEFDLYDPHWSDQPTGPRMVFPFECQSTDMGLEGRPKSMNPLFYFNKMLGDFGVFFGLLATGTNERVHELFDVEAADTEACIKEEITADDLRCFVALCLEMSTMQLPTLADYWSEQAHCGFTGFGNVMSQQRFQLILHTLNFEHIGQGGSVNLPNDPLGEVRPLIEFFNQRMADIYTCGQRLVLNEPVIYWQGKWRWHRSMGDRFRCNAVALHFLTEFSGLVLRITPDIEGVEHKKLTRNSKLLAQHRVTVAKRLLQDKFGQGYTVYASKYYGSCGLAYELANERTYCTGLLDNRRYGNCKQLVLNSLKESAFAVKYASPIMMGKWRRCEKCVYFFSSDCLAIYANETAWRSRDRRPKIIKELEWQLQLSETIRRAFVHYQPIFERKDMKWHRYVTVYILNVMMLNAYILYTKYAPIGGSRVTELHLKDTSKLRSYAEFRQYVIGWLLGTVKEDESEDTSTSKQKRSRKRSHCVNLEEEDGGGNNVANEDAERTQNAAAAAVAAAKLSIEKRHMLVEVPYRNNKPVKRKCRICRKSGMLTLTRHCCGICPGMPGLCATPCFGIWHDQLKLSLRDIGGVRNKSHRE